MLFAENSTTLDPGAKAVVARAVANIRTSRATTVNVIGYTDSNGDSASNQLAGARARTVQVALQADLGRKVTVNSRAEGQADPVASNATAAGQQLNRRVAITTTTVPTTPSGAATTGPTASVAGLPLVGGGAVTPTAATGDLDVAGTAGDVLFAEQCDTRHRRPHGDRPGRSQPPQRSRHLSDCYR